MIKLRADLEKRKSDQLEARDTAFEKASECIAQQQYGEAVAALNAIKYLDQGECPNCGTTNPSDRKLCRRCTSPLQVNPEIWDDQFEELYTSASESLSQLNTLRDEINSAVNSNQLKDLLPVVQECLALKADQDDLVKLQQDLIDRQKTIEARNQQIITQAQQHMQELQFDEAVQILNTITPDYQTETTNNLTQLATRLSEQRQDLLSGVPTALSNKLYQVAVEKISKYLMVITEAGLQDPQLQQMLVDVRNSEVTSIRNRHFIKLGISAVSIVVVLITGMIIKANLDAKALKAAIANQDWEAVYDLDPSNIDGLRWKSAFDKAEAIPVAAMNTLKKHTNAVVSVAFSPDGKTIVSASFDKTIKLWDNQSGTEIKTLTGHEKSVNSVAFSPDGKIIASAGDDKTVKLWDSKSGGEIKTLTGHDDAINSIAFSSDGKTITSASDDETVKIWNSQTGEEIRTLFGHEKSVNSVVFSPDGKTFASAGDTGDKTIKLWYSHSGEEIKTLAEHEGSVRSLAFSPDGKTIVSASFDRTIKLWDVSALAEPSP